MNHSAVPIVMVRTPSSGSGSSGGGTGGTGGRDADRSELPRGGKFSLIGYEGSRPIGSRHPTQHHLEEPSAPWLPPRRRMM
jgi:hypothetical protein